MDVKKLLIEARDLLQLCSLIDKSGQCDSMVEKIDNAFAEEGIDINNIEERSIKKMKNETESN